MFLKNYIRSSKFFHEFIQDGLVHESYRRLMDFPNTFRIFLRREVDTLKTLLNPPLFKLHLRLRKIMQEQRKNWPNFIYSWGYFYQGYKRIGATGVRPTELRFKNYDIVPLLRKDMYALDIGANAGFFSMELAKYVAHVDAIEWNPYQVRIAQEVAAFLNIQNVNFYHDDFNKFHSRKDYDLVMSFANHHTTDGGMRPELRDYFRKIHQILHSDGLLLFESHPQDVNKDFENFMNGIGDLFTTLQKKVVTDGKLGGIRLFYVLKKVQ